MTLNKKLLAVLTILLLVVLLLASCDQNTNMPENGDNALNSESESTAEEEYYPPLNPENIRIFTSNEGNKPSVNFTVIRPKDVSSTSAVSGSVQTILKELTNLLGTAPKNKNDFVKSNAKHNSTTYEILVGYTSYPQSAQAAAKCGYGDYVIDVIDNKIVIMAYTDDSIDAATKAFVSSLRSNYDAKNNVITLKKSEIAETVTCNERLSAIPLLEGGSFYSYYDAGTRDGSMQTQCDEIIIESATPALYDTYLSKLEKSGFTKYTDHTMQGSKFATYTNNEYMINVGFYDYYNEIRIIVESADAPKPALKSENTYTKITDSQITMLGLEYYEKSTDTYASNGLSVLIRLEDGRFVVVDGGFNRAVCAEKLADTIREQASAYTDTPTVAAWIVTHPHGDHNGMINTRVEEFEGIKVESFLLNFIAESEREKAMIAYPNNWSDKEGSNFSGTFEAAQAFGATIYKIHVGQVFHFADLEMEVLYTIESFGPEPCNALNTTSTVIKMNFTNKGNTTTYLSTGDATGIAMEICANMFGDYMKCDIVQACHHGYGTWGNDRGMIKAYTLINAALVLWPQGLSAYNDYTQTAYNKVLFTLPDYKECYVAGGQGDLVIVKLPYVYGKSGNVEVICTAECPFSHYYSDMAS